MFYGEHSFLWVEVPALLSTLLQPELKSLKVNRGMCFLRVNLKAIVKCLTQGTRSVTQLGVKARPIDLAKTS